MKTFKPLFFLLMAIACLSASSCENDDDDIVPSNENGQELSAADKISGLFKGTGKYMPNGIWLGNSNGCVLPTGWEGHFRTGESFANVVKLSDSTVRITLSDGPFSQIVYSSIKVKNNGNSVDFDWGLRQNIGSYDVNSKFLTLSSYTNNSSYVSTNACLTGLPYLAGWSLFNDNNYGFQTIDHADFSGIKQ